jgi:signal transduction histidine kinase
VFCDRTRTLQVLSSLISNAVKFSPTGSTVLVSAEGNGPTVRLSVSDEGPGIAPEDLERVFEPYWPSYSGRKMGRGLGLFISKGIIEAHRGRIWVDSSPGRSTTVSFLLPRALQRRSGARQQSAAFPARAAGPVLAAPAQAWTGPFRRRARGGPFPSKVR